MTRHFTLPRKCRRGHMFIKDKFLTWNEKSKGWTIIRNCKYCIDSQRQEQYFNSIQTKHRLSKEERLLREIFGEKKPSRFYKIVS